MLSDAFLAVLPYTGRLKGPSAAAAAGLQGTAQLEQHGGPVASDAAQRAYWPPPRKGHHMEELAPIKSQGPSVALPPAVSVSIPGCSAGLADLPHQADELNSGCSLIDKYPDLRLCQEPEEDASPRITTSHQSLSTPTPLHTHTQQCKTSSQGPGIWLGAVVPNRRPRTSIPDQGYLEMSGNPSLDPHRSRLAPMSNSLLNGMLEQKVDECYRQYLTDSLARCNSHLGQSLLHGLVPPPQPGTQAQATESLEVSLVATSVDNGPATSYLNTYFSSPVLRISEADAAQ